VPDASPGPNVVVFLTDQHRSALGTADHDRLLREHLLWLDGLERTGRLVISGPVDLDRWEGRGLSVLRGDSRGDVEALAATEPFARAGLRTNTVHAWNVNEGHLRVTVDLFSDHVELS
jgi:uncharacterized protein YciI